jgi:glycerol uptake facilitator-like aquaporin
LTEVLIVMVGSVAANSARDVGGRLANITIYGLKAAGGKYAAIAALTNIPAMIIAVLIYEYLLTDPDRGTVFYLTSDHHVHADQPPPSGP